MCKLRQQNNSIKHSNKELQNKSLENPSVIVITDRTILATHTILPYPGTGFSNYKGWLFTQLQCMFLVNSKAHCSLSVSATLNITPVTEHAKSLCLVQDDLRR